MFVPAVDVEVVPEPFPEALLPPALPDPPEPPPLLLLPPERPEELLFVPDPLVLLILTAFLAPYTHLPVAST